MDRPKFVYTTFIQTTPEKLWEALINPEFTRQYWWGSHLETDWQVGSKLQSISERGVDFEGEVLEYDPTNRLSYTFVETDKDGKLDKSKVTYELEQHDALVRLTVTHDGFEPGSHVFKSISGGWPALLSCLKSLLETGRAINIPGGACHA